MNSREVRAKVQSLVLQRGMGMSMSTYCRNVTEIFAGGTTATPQAVGRRSPVARGKVYQALPPLFPLQEPQALPPCAPRPGPSFTVGSLTYLLWFRHVLGDIGEVMVPCNFSTIVFFGVHGDFCAIDGIFPTPAITGWRPLQGFPRTAHVQNALYRPFVFACVVSSFPCDPDHEDRGQPSPLSQAVTIIWSLLLR